MSYSTFKNYLRNKGFSEQTINRYFGDVCRFLNFCEAENIEAEQAEPREILGYIQQLKNRGNKQRTIQAQISSMKHFYNWQIERGERTDNPVMHIQIKGVKQNSLYDLLSVAELEALYQNFEMKEQKTNQNWAQKQQLTQKRNKQMVGMMVYQGLGVAEFNRLKTEDVKVREGKLYVRGSRRSNARTLNLQAYQIIDLLEYSLQTREQLLELTGKTCELFFVSTGSSERLNGAMEKLMQKLKASNLKPCGERSRTINSGGQIRASVITKWLKVYNLRQVQYMCGHKYVSSTEKYLVNDWEQLQDEIKKYHPIK